MGERMYSTALLTICLLVCLFGARTGLANPVPEEDVQNDQEKPNTSGRVLKKQDSFLVAEGESLIMPCNLEFDDKNAVIWYNGSVPNQNELMFLDDQTVQKGDYYKKHFKVDENKSLVILKVTPETAGTYMCFVSPELSTLHTVAIKVNVEIGHVLKTVGVGENIALSCKVSGYPVPKVEWRRKKSSDPSNTWTVIGTNAERTIQNVDVSDSGIYMCVASNALGEASRNITINVIKDGLTAEQDLVYVNPSSKNASMCCFYTRMHKENATPIRWYKGKLDLYGVSRFNIETRGKLKICLIISKIKDDDLGSYDCKTEKGRGTVEKATIILTAAPEKPILDIVAVDQYKNPVLQWKAMAASPIMSYEVFIRKQGEDAWKSYFGDTIIGNDVSPEVIEQKFEKLPNGQYQVRLVVRNKHGEAEYHSEDSPLIVDKLESYLEPGSGTGEASKNYAGVCVLVTILMTLLHR